MNDLRLQMMDDTPPVVDCSPIFVTGSHPGQAATTHIHEEHELHEEKLGCSQTTQINTDE